jgi:hypothetical protein
MGVLSTILLTCCDALEHYKGEYKFTHLSETCSFDDCTIKDEYGNEYVIAVAFKNKIEGYEPSLPNLGHMLRNYGMKVVYRNPFKQIFTRLGYLYNYKIKKLFRRKK